MNAIYLIRTRQKYKTMCTFLANVAFDTATNGQTDKTRDVLNTFLKICFQTLPTLAKIDFGKTLLNNNN